MSMLDQIPRPRFLGRPLMYGVLGVLTVRAVSSVRAVVSLADWLTGRDSSPCADCAQKRAAVVDAEPPAGPAAGDPSSPFAGDDLAGA